MLTITTREFVCHWGSNWTGAEYRRSIALVECPMMLSWRQKSSLFVLFNVISFLYNRGKGKVKGSETVRSWNVAIFSYIYRTYRIRGGGKVGEGEREGRTGKVNELEKWALFFLCLSGTQHPHRQSPIANTKQDLTDWPTDWLNDRDTQKEGLWMA